MRKKITIPVGQETVSAIISSSRSNIPPGMKALILAHGAGNDMHNSLLDAVSDGTAQAGYLTVRFNFPYKEKGRKAPDPQHKLEGTWNAVCRHVITQFSPKEITAAGKSMGGRIASQLASEGILPVQRLVFYGYPLHPPGKKESLRDSHLYLIRQPMLFFAGTRDPLCDLTELRKVLNKLKAPWDLEIIDGGDHSFNVPKSSGIQDADIYKHLINKSIDWLQRK